MGMKKRYTLLFSLTLLAIAGILLSKPLLQRSIPSVSIYTVEARSAQDTVTCTGRIEAADSEEVYADISCIAATVPVQAGQEVKRGDILFTVDVEATKEVIAAAAGVSPSLVPEQQIVKSVSAPVDGVIRSLNVAEGEAVDTETPCVVISSSDALQVKITIPEGKLKEVEVGQSVLVSGVAFQKEGYAGTLTYISPSARQQYSGTSSETVVDAVVTLSERDDSLKPGLSAKSQILVESAQDRIVLPYEYVQQDEENQEYVYLYQNGRAVKRIVQTGREWNDGFEIETGLSIGDRVIQEPSAVEKDGCRVAVAAQPGEGQE